MPALEMDIPLLPKGVASAADLARAGNERRRRMMRDPMIRVPAPKLDMAADAPMVAQRAPARDWLAVASLVEGLTVTPQEVITTVCRHFRIAPEMVLSHRRDGDICHARRIAMYLAVKLCAVSSAYLAEAFNRDRSSVLQAAKALKQSLDERPTLIAEVERLWDMLDRRVG
ncbi:DnaA-like protein [Azorhizobium sp. AG788]|uniref:helix-turn-helix domain-containing protein n=1 Tax=Azorhizobium sp. AG788 TaxID=2183897 RepID=UPI0010613784|nr:helix-turn-helix domain-containing protein [Azorhizobium sp. AG788]TDT94902.1 DnaA-like protein [Azorhizobium sp. AG788]